ncbi:FkbM family methyltransferase [Bacteroidota bacterium]
MRNQKKQLLYRKLFRKSFYPSHCAEVGVYHPETSNIRDYVKTGVKCTLVEPDPKSIQLIKEHYSDLSNVELHEVALFDYNGEIELVQRCASTFVKDLPSSPSIINDDYKISDNDKFTVECKTFDKIDDGSIDLLSVDIEGSEWFVIKHMVSRPTVISLETHGASYINPYWNEIINWVDSNNYVIWYKTGSDTVFVQNGKIKITFFDRSLLRFKDFRLHLRKQRKDLLKKLFH